MSPLPGTTTLLLLQDEQLPSPSHNNTWMMATNWGLETHLCLEFLGAFILLQDSQGGTGLETQIHLEP